MASSQPGSNAKKNSELTVESAEEEDGKWEKVEVEEEEEEAEVTEVEGFVKV